MKTIYQNGRYRYIRKVGSPAYKIQKRFLWVFWLNHEHRYNSYGYDGLESDMVPWVVYSKQEAVNIVNMLEGKVEPMPMRKTSTRWPEEIEALNQEQRKELEVWLKENFETDLLKLYEVEEGKTMKITKEDVGRKVINGEGNIETIEEWYEDHEYPVETDKGCYTSDGVYPGWSNPTVYNLVGFADEKESQE